MRLLVGDPRGLWLILVAALGLLALAQRRRRRTVRLTTFFLLQRLTEQLPLLSRRVRLLRRLAHALAAAGALAAACAGLRPTIVTDAPALRELVVLDLSPSLGVREPDGTVRLAGLKRAVDAYLEQVRPEDTLVMIEAGSRPAVLAPPDPAAARARLLALDYADAAVDTSRAALLAAALHRQEPFDHVLVFTDRPARWAAAAAVEGFSPRFVSLGGATVNAGIDRFDLQPDLFHASAWRLFARVSCPEAAASGGTPPARIEVRNNGSVAATIERRCADGTAEIDLQGLTLEPGTVEVRLTAQDAYPADDRVVAGIAAPALAHVYLVSGGNRFLEAALSADPALRFELISPEKPLPRAPQAVFVFDGMTPPGPLPDRALFIRPDRAIGSLTPRSYASFPDRITWERDDPLMRAVDLEWVVVRDYVEFLPDPWFREAAAADGRPLVLSLAEEGRRWVVMAFDPAETNLVYTPSYPLLVANAIRWLSTFSPSERPWLPAGERVALPAEACGGRVLTPDGAVMTLAEDCASGLSFDAARHPGTYRVEGRAGDLLGVFHVNVLDPGVTAEVAASGYGQGGAPLPPELGRGPSRVDLTPWLALAALALFAASRLVAPAGASARA